MGISQAGTGRGAGFTLGPANNLFGTTSGDATQTVPGVAAAANKAAAETTRDTYFTANPSNLAVYDADRNLNIRVFFVDGGDNVIVHQVRQGSAWIDNGSVTGIQGLPGSATDLSSVGADNIPIVGAGPGFLPEASGISLNADGQLESSKDFRVPGAQWNQAIALGSGVEELCFRNITRNTQHHPPLRAAELDASDRVLNKVHSGAKVTDDVRQAVDTETLVDPSFDLIVDAGTADGFRIESFQVNFASAATTPKLTVTRNSLVVYEHTFGNFNAGVQRIALMTGVADDPGFIDVRDGDTYTLQVSDASLLGNLSGVPWYTLTFRRWTEEEMALLSDVPTIRTDEDIRDVTAAQLTQGTGITLTEDDPNNTLTIATTVVARTDEDIRDVVVAMLTAGTGITLTEDDVANTLTITATNGGGGTNPPAPADVIYYGLSDTNNPASVDLLTLTEEQDPTNPDTISTGTATAGQFFILLVPQADDVTSIFDTVLQQDVITLFTETDNVRTISTVSYKSYVIGPLRAGVSEEYVINFGSP